MPKFVYPYNFVPQADREYCRKDGYKPLNRQNGHSGRIDFTLTNLSPLFIPDAEKTTYYHITDENGNLQYDDNEEPKYHRVMDFFNVNNQLAIPGTALKGMIRSVAEALSSSTFGVFAPEEKPFAFRKTDDLGADKLRNRRWGKWTNDGKIEPYETAKICREDFDKALSISDETERIKVYKALRESRTIVKAELWELHTGAKIVQSFSGKYNCTVFNNAVSPPMKGKLKRRKTNKSIIDMGKSKYHGPLINPILRRLGITPNESGPWDVEFKTVSGVPVVENKKKSKITRQKRICWVRRLDEKGKPYGPTWKVNIKKDVDIIIWPRSKWDKMEDSQRDYTHYVFGLYKGSGLREVADEAKANYKIANKGELPEPGDIVRYYAVKDSTGKFKVVEFGPVAMYKTAEKASVKDIAKKSGNLQPCRSNEELCPASRLFGWTPESSDGKEEKHFPVAGRVRVGVAWSEKIMTDTCLIPLQILGSPKPQYYPFYLRPETGDPSQTGYYATSPEGWWHRAGLLRGRKFYLHHPNTLCNPHDTEQANQNQSSPGSPSAACKKVEMTPYMDKEATGKINKKKEVTPEDLRSHQNVTAAVLPPGAQFAGYVEFESLDDYELGLLLWAISLADSPLEGCSTRAHKLGMGRPIGMGSVQLKIDYITTWNPLDGWQDNPASGNETVETSEADRLVKIFKNWMITGEPANSGEPDENKVEEFNRQNFYQDLCTLLNLYVAGSDPVQYHPTYLPAYEGFRYFMDQRKKRNKNKGEEQTLKTPAALLNSDRQT